MMLVSIMGVVADGSENDDGAMITMTTMLVTVADRDTPRLTMVMMTMTAIMVVPDIGGEMRTMVMAATTMTVLPTMMGNGVDDAIVLRLRWG